MGILQLLLFLYNMYLELFKNKILPSPISSLYLPILMQIGVDWPVLLWLVLELKLCSGFLGALFKIRCDTFFQSQTGYLGVDWKCGCRCEMEILLVTGDFGVNGDFG